jgi:hypothetical protein
MAAGVSFEKVVVIAGVGSPGKILTADEPPPAGPAISRSLRAEVSEDVIVPRVDSWLAKLFDHENLGSTCEALALAEGIDEATEVRLEAARRKILDCDARLAKYRAALDAGADATIVAGWMAEEQSERPRAQGTSGQVRTMVLALHDIASVLATADPNLKAEVHAELGISVTYDHERQLVAVQARPTAECVNRRVGEAYRTICTRPWQAEWAA